MTWIASGVALAAGIGGSMLSGKAASKAARRQAALARKQAARLRQQYAVVSAGAKREIESLRILRSLDLPAFRQASEHAVIQAKKGSERMQRQRMMGRQAGDVREAIFGGEFQQYVGREVERLGQYTSLTKDILGATERQQQMAMQVETQASNMELTGQMQAIQTELSAGDIGANILGSVGAAASAYAAAASAKATAADKNKAAFKQQYALMAADPNFDAAKWQSNMAAVGGDGGFDAFWDNFMGGKKGTSWKVGGNCAGGVCK